MLQTQLLRFLLAGAVNTAFGFGVFAALTWLGASAALALALGTVAGILFNFVTYGGYAFRDLVLARLPRFCAAYGAVYLLNLALLLALASWPMSHISAQAILTAPMALISYSLMKRFVFVGVQGK